MLSALLFIASAHLDALDTYAVRYTGPASLGALPHALNLPAGELREISRHGNVVHLQQYANGLPVLFAQGKIELTANGVIARVAHDFVTVGAVPEATVSEAQAARIANAQIGHVDSAQSGARLSVLVRGTETRSVYEVPVASWRPTERLVAYVDARSGKVLFHRNLALADTSYAVNVYDTNSIEDATLVSRTTSTTDGTAFAGTYINTRNCLITDLSKLEFTVLPIPAADIASIQTALGQEIDYAVLPLCAEVATARPDAAGTYQPETTANQFTDQFSEEQFYFHADRMARFYRNAANASDGGLGLGYAWPTIPVLPGTVNFQTPNYVSVLCASALYAGPAPTSTNAAAVTAAARTAFSARHTATITYQGLPICQSLSSSPQPQASDYQAFDNAFFLPADDQSQVTGPLAGLGNIRNYDSMVFGQGQVDYSYDGNVIYHEYTHSIVKAVAAFQDGTYFDTTGPDDAPGAMNEGIADYFSSVRAGNPCVGEPEAILVSATAACLRDLDNHATCPGALVGEVHTDSLSFSGALWQARTAYAAQAAKFDVAVFDTLTVVGNHPQFKDFLSTLQTKVVAQGLDPAPLVQAGTDHNVLACKHEIPLVAGTGSATIDLLAREDDEGPFMPGFVQYTVTVPALTKTVEFTLDIDAGGQSSSIAQTVAGLLNPSQVTDVRVIAQKGAPIAFGQPYAVPAGQTPVSIAGGNATVEVDEIAGATYYVAVLNFNAQDHSIGNLQMTVSEPLAASVGTTSGGGSSSGSTSGASSGSTSGAGSVVATTPATTAAKGGCTQTEAGNALLVLFAAAIALARRRR